MVVTKTCEGSVDLAHRVEPLGTVNSASRAIEVWDCAERRHLSGFQHWGHHHRRGRPAIVLLAVIADRHRQTSNSDHADMEGHKQ